LAWFVAGIAVANGSEVLIPLRLPTGESYCMRCGTALEAFPEFVRAKLLMVLLTSTPTPNDQLTRRDFTKAAEMAEVPPDRRNFRPRSVHKKVSTGFELQFDVGFVPRTAFEEQEKTGDLSKSTDMPPQKVTVPGGAEVDGYMCMLHDLPEKLFHYKGIWYYREEADLSEEFMTPHDQLRDGQGLATLKFVSAEIETGRAPDARFQKMTSIAPSYRDLQLKAAQFKKKSELKDTAIRDFVAGLNPSLSTTPNAPVVTQICSGSRFESFRPETSTMGLTVVSSASSGGGPAPKRRALGEVSAAARTPAMPRRSSSSLPAAAGGGTQQGVPAPITPAPGTPRKQAMAELALASGVVFRRPPVTSPSPSSLPGADPLSPHVPSTAAPASQAGDDDSSKAKSSKGGARYEHKDIDINEILSACHNPGQQVAPAAQEIETHWGTNEPCPWCVLGGRTEPAANLSTLRTFHVGVSRSGLPAQRPISFTRVSRALGTHRRPLSVQHR
jgi:hypothetical protein